MKKRVLRSGFTTGACAAAAAKAATLLLIGAEEQKIGSTEAENNCSELSFPQARRAGNHSEKQERFRKSRNDNNFDTPSVDIVSILFPDGTGHTFKIHDAGFRNNEGAAFASVIKDAGDDPDVTNGAEIAAEVKLVRKRGSAEAQKSENSEGNNFLAAELQTSDLPVFQPSALIIKGGKGVGIVTKPGLAVAVGEPAINPVPRKMITDAVSEALTETRAYCHTPLQSPSGTVITVEITIYIPDGEALAKKTLNERLGIVGGLSILGTTGYVRPLSAEAWTATITSSMEVAKAMGRTTIVLSAGRTSEKAHMKSFSFPEESYVMMGDYLEFSLREAARLGFERIELCAQWAKMLKIAMSTPQTHVRHGAIEMAKTVELLRQLGVSIPAERTFNTAREIFDYLQAGPGTGNADQILKRVCNSAKSYIADIANPLDIIVYLVSYNGEIIAYSK